jgi:hypothetical protein
MSFGKEFVDEIVGGLDERTAAAEGRPGVEVWPADDDYANWLASHESPGRAVICASPEFASAPFCGRGYH